MYLRSTNPHLSLLCSPPRSHSSKKMAVALLASVFALLLSFSIGAPLQQEAQLPVYSRFAMDATAFPSEFDYDYIIVGGGTAGCPLAATLSEHYSVLLLERGGPPYDFPDVMTQDGFLRALIDTGAPDSPTQSFVSDDGVANARGRVLGGSSAVNAGFYSRAHPGFFAATSSVPWDRRLVNESYHWVEQAVTFRPILRSWQSAVRDGLLEANVTPYNGFTVEHVPGTKIGASTFDSEGRRHSAADLLDLAVADNIRVALRATADQVLLNPVHHGNKAGQRRNQNAQAAIGVVYRDRTGQRHHAMVRPGGEVIVTSGALGSPQMLLLSGVGPRQHLAAMGISVAVDNPNVGKYMYDNPRNGIAIIPNAQVDHSLIQVVGIPGDGSGAENSFLEAASTVVSFSAPYRSAFFHPGGDVIPPLYATVASLIEKVPGPASYGSLRLGSLDASDNPRVRFNYFSRPVDLARCVAGVRRIGEVMEGRSMEDFRAALPGGWWFDRGGGRREFRYVGATLPANRSDAAAMGEFCKRTLATIWHYHGGCLLGKVVDGEFRVKGVDGLRVVDGSTFAVSPGTNPQATLMMMGRYMGRRMMDQRRRNYRRNHPPPPPPRAHSR